MIQPTKKKNFMQRSGTGVSHLILEPVCFPLLPFCFSLVGHHRTQEHHTPKNPQTPLQLMQSYVVAQHHQSVSLPVNALSLSLLGDALTKNTQQSLGAHVMGVVVIVLRYSRAISSLLNRPKPPWCFVSDVPLIQASLQSMHPRPG